MNKSYSELRRYDGFEERFRYLKLDGAVGHSTFGFDRYINQRFYASYEWRQARREVIIRDNGCDLGIDDYPVVGAMLVHHMNPMSIDDLIHGEESIINPEYLILTTMNTHNAIHFGDESLLPKVVVSRSPHDTKLW